MDRIALGLLLATLTACHGQLGQRSTPEETELNNFAEARVRALTYYDGGDFERAAAEFKKALVYRPKHVTTRMGYAYSLMFINRPSSLLEAEKEFTTEIGTLRDPKKEVKRIYGLALTHRSLAAQFDRRSRIRDSKGELKGAQSDRADARKNAEAGISDFNRVIELDQVLARDQQLSAFRVSASLTPDAHVGIAHCEIILMTPDPGPNIDSGKIAEEHLARAQEHLRTFAQIAQNARTFWQKRRAALLVVDPLKDQNRGLSTPQEKQRYEERIANTINQEVAVRRLMMETLLFLNEYRKAIDEATTILELDPAQDDVLLFRGKAFAWLDPPKYSAALRDLKDYRMRQPRDRLTDELVRLNKDIQELERRVRDEK